MSDHTHEVGERPVDKDALPTCKFCSAEVLSIDAMRDHKREKLQEELEAGGSSYVHLWCDICDLDFHTLASLAKHRRQFHAEKQDLSCPGCGKHFVKLSDFVKHIELDECPNLSLENLMARMHQRMSWVKGLGHIDSMSKEDVFTRHEKNFYPYLGHEPIPSKSWKPSDCKPPPWQDIDAGDWPAPVRSENESFSNTARNDYLRGNTKAPDLLTGDVNGQLQGEDSQDAWTKKKILFPNVPVSKQPTAEQLLRLEDDQRAVEQQRERRTNPDPADPNSPMFSADKFWVEYIRKYKCPHKQCKKSFTKKATFVQHLRSAAHKGIKTSCPACLSHFDSLYALAAHVESQSERCHMRRSTAYGWFLNQLTWGTAEVSGTLGDNMPKYQFQKGFLNDYGPQKTTGSTYGDEQVYGPQGFDSSVASDNHPQLTAGALDKQQREMMSSAMHSKPYTQRIQQKQQQKSSCDFDGGGDNPVPLTAEALSRLNLQDRQNGNGTWFQSPGNTRSRSSDTPVVQQQQQTGDFWGKTLQPQEKQQQNGTDWYRPSGPLVAQQQQQQQTGGFWGQPSQPQEKKQKDGDDWYQPSGSAYSQQGGYSGAQKGAGYVW
ncbi:hypothetical protein VSDG_07136 [Cytospora chrysosperma]|uniref:C2H2-type domain-containing protein n=1 Tax=Cytospora chrysosperma TaxID=252740 RepID=A0A423VKE1_CYTCH|nr:hypothetical protein VSDG_07136 [Valsa sordida]